MEFLLLAHFRSGSNECMTLLHFHEKPNLDAIESNQ